MARVLIVEDERVVARDLSHMLTELGHAVTGMAASFDAAMRTQQETPADIVLLDIKIDGDRDGISLAVELREDHDVAIAFITSHADSATLSQAAATRANGILIKPFTRAQVDALVTVALANHQSRARDIDRTTLARERDRAPGRLSEAQLEKVRRFVDQRLNGPIEIRELAALCDLGKFTFSRRFRTATGNSPYQFVLEQRVREAKRLLRNTDWPLAQIALAVGFANQAHLTTTFHRMCRVTPAVYRRTV